MLKKSEVLISLFVYTTAICINYLFASALLTKWELYKWHIEQTFDLYEFDKVLLY